MDPDHKIPIGVAFIAPSITPLTFVRDGVNPSFRSYHYDHLEREIISYNQYYIPLEKLIDEDNDEEDDDYVYDNQDYGAEETETNRSLYNSKRMFKRQANESNEIPRFTEANATEADPEETTTLANNSEDLDEDEESDVDKLVKDWIFAYNAAVDFEIKAMDVKGLQKVYSKMKVDPQGVIFKHFMRHAFVLHNKSDGLDCNSTCHADIICTITEFTEENFKDCLVEKAVLHGLDPVTSTSTTPTTTTLATSTTTRKVLKTTFHYWTTAKPIESQTREPVKETTGHSNVVRGVVIGLALVALICMAVTGLYMYRKMQRRRYCSQEFLLDSFRYDGYSQIDQPAT